MNPNSVAQAGNPSGEKETLFFGRVFMVAEGAVPHKTF